MFRPLLVTMLCLAFAAPSPAPAQAVEQEPDDPAFEELLDALAPPPEDTFEVMAPPPAVFFWAAAPPFAAEAEALEAMPAEESFEAEPAPPPQFQGPGGGPGWQRRGFRMRGGPGYGPGFGRGQGVGPGFGFGPGGPGGRSGMGRGFGRGRGFGPEMLLFRERMRRELGLTEEQSKRLHQLGLEARRNSIRRRADLETKRLDLRELLRAEQPDRAAIDRAVRELAELQAAQMKAGIDLRLGAQEVLTPEQRQQLRQLRERGFRERKAPGPEGERFRGRPGRRPGPPSEQAPAPSAPQP